MSNDNLLNISNKTRIDKARDWLERNKVFMNLVTILTLAAAGIFALFQHFSSVNKERVNQVLTLELRFNGKRLNAAKDRISDAWVGENFSNYDAHIQNAETGNSVWYDYNIDVIENKLQVNDVIQVTNFFEALSTCIKNDLCDKKTSIAFFSTYVNEFFFHHTVFICRQRNDRGDFKFAQGVAEILLLAHSPETSVDVYMEKTCNETESLKRQKKSIAQSGSSQ